MANSICNELRKKTDFELIEIVRKLKSQLLEVRFKIANGDDENSNVNQIKKTIARSLTILNERDVAFDSRTVLDFQKDDQQKVSRKLFRETKSKKVIKTSKVKNEKPTEKQIKEIKVEKESKTTKKPIIEKVVKEAKVEKESKTTKKPIIEKTVKEAKKQVIEKPTKEAKVKKESKITKKPIVEKLAKAEKENKTIKSKIKKGI